MTHPVPQLSKGLAPASIRDIARRHGASNVLLFGSRAHGTAAPDSDLDILVRLERGRDLLDLVALKQELVEKTGLQVDVLTESTLSPYMRDHVMREAVPL
jgi:predicted nucleotidyltransferase